MVWLSIHQDSMSVKLLRNYKNKGTEQNCWIQEPHIKPVIPLYTINNQLEMQFFLKIPFQIERKAIST